MVATLDVAEAADRLVRLLVPRLADWATLTVLGDDDTPGRTARAHRDPSRLPDVDAYLAGRRSGARDRPEFIGALLAGRPVRLPRLDPSDVAPTLPTPETRAAWERLAPASALFVPLRAQGGTFGVLSLLNGPDRPPHTGEEVATAVEVARRGSLALDNARLYSRQVRIAETLQRSLLTPPLRTDALDVAVRYRPASSSALVGGDFYDAFEQDDAAVLVVGDVAGHALEAATAMAQLRSAVRTLAWDRPESPARTLTRVDRALTGLGFGTLATVLVARVEPGGDGRTLRWSSAGHPPPMLAAPSGRVQVLQTPPEALLGAEMTTGRSDHEAVLRPGETLVLYTDGLVEHRRRTIDEGTARLAEALSDLAHRPLEELCDELLDRLLGDRSDDDVVLLAARPA
jgi:serine phosphatase RsbU (regulator of sigma subunit)